MGWLIACWIETERTKVPDGSTMFERGGRSGRICVCMVFSSIDWFIVLKHSPSTLCSCRVKIVVKAHERSNPKLFHYVYDPAAALCLASGRYHYLSAPRYLFVPNTGGTTH
jgi:hypothetical protein